MHNFFCWTLTFQTCFSQEVQTGQWECPIGTLWQVQEIGECLVLAALSDTLAWVAQASTTILRAWWEDPWLTDQTAFLQLDPCCSSSWWIWVSSINSSSVGVLWQIKHPINSIQKSIQKLHDVIFAGPYDVGMGMNSFSGQAPPPQSPSWPDSGMGMEGAQNANR